MDDYCVTIYMMYKSILLVLPRITTRTERRLQRNPKAPGPISAKCNLLQPMQALATYGCIPRINKVDSISIAAGARVLALQASI